MPAKLGVAKSSQFEQEEGGIAGEVLGEGSQNSHSSACPRLCLGYSSPGY